MRALVDYVLGESCIVHATTVFMKGPTDPPETGLQLPLHTDQQWLPNPFPPYALITGATLLLTDYTRENGAFAYVPGSHHLARVTRRATRCTTVRYPWKRRWDPCSSTTARCGTVRSVEPLPGLRAGLAYAHSRMFVTPLEAYREHVTKEILDRNPPRFAKLLGQAVPTGSTEEGPDLEKVYFAVAVRRSPESARSSMSRPIAPEVFTWPSDEPQLVGSRCTACSTVVFPQAPGCPRCGSTEMERHELGRRGRLWTFTTQGFLPKAPYLGPETEEDFEGYGVGYVELPGETMVEGRLTEGDPARLEIGMEMELVIVPFRTDPDGTEVMTYAFAPVDGAASTRSGGTS